MDFREIKELYQSCDNEISEFDKICKKGCSHCYQSVTVAFIEGGLIDQYVEHKMPKHTKRSVKENLKRWFSFFNENIPERNLTINDIPEFERKQSKMGVQGDLKGLEIRQNIYRKIFKQQGHDHFRLLPYAVAEKLGYKGRLKQISFPVSFFKQ